MELKQIGTTRIKRDRRCDLCGDERPEMARGEGRAAQRSWRLPTVWVLAGRWCKCSKVVSSWKSRSRGSITISGTARYATGTVRRAKMKTLEFLTDLLYSTLGALVPIVLLHPSKWAVYIGVLTFAGILWALRSRMES